MTTLDLLSSYIVVVINCALPQVRYPHGKVPDLYGTIEGHPVRCFRCNRDLGAEGFAAHIRSHAGRDKNLPIIFVNGRGEMVFERAETPAWAVEWRRP